MPRAAPRCAALALLLLGTPLEAQTLLYELPFPGGEPISVAGVADLDGDGRGDVLAGDGEHAYAFSGATGALLYTFSSINPDPDYVFGTSVAGVGDFDGDGHGDLAVGSREYGLQQPGELNGAVYLFSGVDGSLIEAIFVKDFPHTEFGASLAPLRYADGEVGFVAGAPGRFGCKGDDSERVFLFKPGAFREVIENPDPCNGDFGVAVAGVPDLDGDGGGDVVVGAPTFNPNHPDGGPRFGRAYVFDGTTRNLLYRVDPPEPVDGGLFGSAVAALGDVDGDARGDFLVGAANGVYAFSGSTGSLLYALEPHASFSGVPDVDGDGRGDVLASGTQGAAVYRGATGALLYRLGAFSGPVASVPDVDGDGYSDFVVGAHVFSAPPPLHDCPLSFVKATLTPLSVAPGGTSTAALVVANDGPSPRAAHLRLQYVRDGGGPTGAHALGSGTVPVTSGVAASVSHRVPGNAPAGIYRLTLELVDAQGGQVCDTRSFVLTVETSRLAPPTASLHRGGGFFESAGAEGLFTVGTEEAATGVAAVSEVVVWPNPASVRATTAFTLGTPADVRLTLHDVLGREVMGIDAGQLEAGVHRLPLDASALPAGVYVWRLAVGTEMTSGRLTVAR